MAEHQNDTTPGEHATLNNDTAGRCLIIDLPMELVEGICEHVEDRVDLKAFRLLCRELEAKSRTLAIKKIFAKVHTRLTERRFRHLAEMAEHKLVGPAVKCIIVTPVHYLNDCVLEEQQSEDDLPIHQAQHDFIKLDMDRKKFSQLIGRFANLSKIEVGAYEWARGDGTELMTRGTTINDHHYGGVLRPGRSYTFSSVLKAISRSPVDIRLSHLDVGQLGLSAYSPDILADTPDLQCLIELLAMSETKRSAPLSGLKSLDLALRNGRHDGRADGGGAYYLMERFLRLTPNLESLKLAVPSGWLTHVCEEVTFSNLRHLHLRGCMDERNFDSFILRHASTLRTLELHECNFGNAHVDSIRDLLQSTKLHLRHLELLGLCFRRQMLCSSGRALPCCIVNTEHVAREVLRATKAICEHRTIVLEGDEDYVRAQVGLRFAEMQLIDRFV